MGAKTFDASSWVSHVESEGADGRNINLRPIYYYDSKLKEDKKEIELTSDKELLDVAVSEAHNYKVDRVVVGKIASSNSWNRQTDRIKFLYEKYGSSCEEMETHAAAHICRIYDMPFLGIRILSNSEIHGEKFNPATGEVCQRYVLNVINSYAKRKNLGE